MKNNIIPLEKKNKFNIHIFSIPLPIKKTIVIILCGPQNQITFV